MTVIFETDRLVVRPLAKDDADALFGIYGNPEVTRYVTPNGEAAPDIGFIHSQLQHGMLAPQEDPRFGFWGIERRHDATLVGTGALVLIDDTDNEYEMGWHLAPEFWGAGYAFESGVGLLRHGFEKAGLEEILALVHPENDRSLRACRRLGLEPRPRRLNSGYEHECFAADKRTWSPPSDRVRT